ncbi:hypothetical protein LTR78_003327 [Recurvomyces mirabilis]|uniref:Enoyl reductase (ER) domain-containing protein n=1 Tax=Recurvomyces mirabilis TaxID=574656 RepID=A0AAE0WSK0_9PEZI|nr:hypothetical protein LTR78_003327 [Recurvomyces mirabilis]KAK5156855.1 hypothetical protein LTS14_004372 [Recurvomyces mirabilis]
MGSGNMLEAHVHEDTSVTLVSIPIPHVQGPNDIVVRVICASCNPKDWKMPAGLLKTISDCPNSGDDVAGIVHEVGSAVTLYKRGDRVAALHQLGAPYGAYAEFALVKDFVTFHIPPQLEWEQAATMPMASYMACIALFGSLQICAGPWETAQRPPPLLIYGAATGVGSLAVKLAQVAEIHPLLCVAGGGADFVAGLIDESKGDAVFDYRKGDEALVQDIKSALHGQELEYAFDAVSEKSSIANVSKVLKSKGGKIALTLPGRAHELSDQLEISHVMAGSLWKKLVGRHEGEQLGNLGVEDGPAFAKTMTSSIEKMLSEGVLAAHPHVVYEGGLTGLERALKDLRGGRVSAKRCVVRVIDTPGRHAPDIGDGI